ncbi:60S ribosomal protein l23, partial [Trifolium pratense]
VQMTISSRVFQPLYGVFGVAVMLSCGITNLSMLPELVYSQRTPFVTTIGVCFRDSSDTLVQAHTLYFPHVSPAVECEASTLLVALQIAVESGYAQVNFESDCQTVVNAITNSDAYDNELDTILTSCRSLISSNASYNLAFIRRQANRVVHNLARASIFQSSPGIFYYPPHCIDTIIRDEIN